MRLSLMLFLSAITSLIIGCADEDLPPVPCDWKGVVLLGGDIQFKPYPKGCTGTPFRMPNSEAAGEVICFTTDGEEKLEHWINEARAKYKYKCDIPGGAIRL